MSTSLLKTPLELDTVFSYETLTQLGSGAAFAKLLRRLQRTFRVGYIMTPHYPVVNNETFSDLLMFDRLSSGCAYKLNLSIALRQYVPSSFLHEDNCKDVTAITIYDGNSNNKGGLAFPNIKSSSFLLLNNQLLNTLKSKVSEHSSYQKVIEHLTVAYDTGNSAFSMEKVKMVANVVQAFAQGKLHVLLITHSYDPNDGGDIVDYQHYCLVEDVLPFVDYLLLLGADTPAFNRCYQQSLLQHITPKEIDPEKLYVDAVEFSLFLSDTNKQTQTTIEAHFFKEI